MFSRSLSYKPIFLSALSQIKLFDPDKPNTLSTERTWMTLRYLRHCLSVSVRIRSGWQAPYDRYYISLTLSFVRETISLIPPPPPRPNP